MVSIIVPVYNIEQYLRTCLDSLAAQTWKHMEILLIDDGSTDQSGAICDEYAGKDGRFHVIHKENGGVSSARNAGISEASGEYLMFVDGDDFVHPRMVEACMTHGNSGKHLLCTYTSDPDTWERLQKDGWKGCLEEADRSDFMMLFYRDYMNVPFNKLYQTEIIKEYKLCFPTNKDLGEDLLFNLAYYTRRRGDYLILREPLYFYRENREGSLSTGYKSGLFELQQELFGAVREFLIHTDIWTEENQKTFWGMYLDRLYLTMKMCKAYERTHPKEKRLAQLLRDPVWKEVWTQCGKKGVLNWKRKLKKISLKYYGAVNR